VHYFDTTQWVSYDVCAVLSGRRVLPQWRVCGRMLRRWRHIDDVSAVRAHGGRSMCQDWLRLRRLLRGRAEWVTWALLGQTVLQHSCAWHWARQHRPVPCGPQELLTCYLQLHYWSVSVVSYRFCSLAYLTKTTANNSERFNLKHHINESMS